MRVHPLITEAGRVIAGGATLKEAYFAMLVTQAVVLVLWWPKLTLVEALVSASAPVTLTALFIAIGVTLAYQALRVGVEEVAMAERQSMREWVIGARLPVVPLLLGWLGAQLLHATHWLLLAAPFIAIAAPLSGSPWLPVAWCCAALLVHTLCWNAIGALSYLHFGHHAMLTYLGARCVLASVYLVTALWVPSMSAVQLPYRLFEKGLAPAALAIDFIAGHVAVLLVLLILLGSQLQRLRRSASALQLTT